MKRLPKMEEIRMRAPWMYRVGAFLCLIAAGISIAIDSHFSHGWIDKAIGTHSLITTGLCVVIATIATSVGALITHAESWLVTFNYTLEFVARIESEKERVLRLIGLCITSAFLFLMVFGTYGINLYSNYYAIRPFSLSSWDASAAAGLICFSSDACLAFHLTLSHMARNAKMVIDNINENIKARARTSRKAVD